VPSLIFRGILRPPHVSVMGPLCILLGVSVELSPVECSLLLLFCMGGGGGGWRSLWEESLLRGGGGA